MHGAIFAVQVQSDLRSGAIAVQTQGRPLLSHQADMWFEAAGAVSRYKFDRSHYPSHGTETIGRADERIRVYGKVLFC